MRYIYRAKDWNGKLVKGVLELDRKEEVVESLKDNGLVPLSVVLEKNGVLAEFNKKFFGRVSLKQVTMFTRQLSTMMTAGLPLTDALSLLKNQVEQNTVMYEILDSALSTVRGGKSLGEALGKYKSTFGEAYVASIVAGEEGGVLQEVLEKLSKNLENESEFKGKVKGAMVYPAIVVVGMIIVTFIMMIFVIPKLLSLYQDFGSEMPMPTRILMSISGFTTKFWYLFPGIIFGVMFLLKVSNQNEAWRLKKDSFMLKMPIMGELNRKTVVANTIRTLSMLLTAGISLVEALKIVSSVAGNELYRQAYLKVAERVQKGFSVANSFEEMEVFPTIVNQMAATGEATGKLDEVLMKVANYFSTEAEQSVKTLTSAIEPLIMILLGIGVGFLVIAVIMPIYNLTSQF
ncbi:type II secretion system F family protein [Patescibacteria group bacterium]|nr:type II secretion system F family protein [Patescibacteria group bacterium]